MRQWWQYLDWSTMLLTFSKLPRKMQRLIRNYGYWSPLNCPSCGAIGIRFRLLEEICDDYTPRYGCSNFFNHNCTVEYFDEDGAF